MLPLLADENLNGDIVRGLLRRQPELNLIRIQDIELAGANDPQVLAWAAEDGRIIMTHDRATLPHYAFHRVVSSERMPGVFVLNDRMPVAQAIEELLLIDACSEPSDWDDRVLYLPL